MQIAVLTSQRSQASLPMCSHLLGGFQHLFVFHLLGIIIPIGLPFSNMTGSTTNQSCCGQSCPAQSPAVFNEWLPSRLIHGHLGHRSRIRSRCEQQHHSPPLRSMEIVYLFLDFLSLKNIWISMFFFVATHYLPPKIKTYSDHWAILFEAVRICSHIPTNTVHTRI